MEVWRGVRREAFEVKDLVANGKGLGGGRVVGGENLGEGG